MLSKLPQASHVYLSPHLDDAVLSCGALIYQQALIGERVVVLTLFAGDPPDNGELADFARTLHALWATPNPTVARRAEDLAALAALHPSVQAIHLPLPDCIYRRDPSTGGALYASPEAVLGDVHPDDPALAALSVPPELFPGTRLYAPLGIGRHVDHQITRRAAEDWAIQLCYYEDYPYAARDGYRPASEPVPPGWRREAIQSSQEALDAKIRAVACYASQLSMFWSDAPEMTRDIREYKERMWYPPE